MGNRRQEGAGLALTWFTVMYIDVQRHHDDEREQGRPPFDDKHDAKAQQTAK